MSPSYDCVEWYTRYFSMTDVRTLLIRTTHHLKVGTQCLTQTVQATVYYNSNEAACKNE